MKKRLRSRKKNRAIGFIFALPALLGVFVFFLVPFCISVGISFTNGMGDLTFVGFRNYASLLGNPTFQLAAINTGRFIGVGVVSILLFSLVLSLLIQKKTKRNDMYKAFFLFPLVLPTASVILFFQLLFHGNGIVDGLFIRLGLPVADWLRSPYAFYVLILLFVWKNFGYNVILFVSAFHSIPPVYYEFANLEGAGELRKFRYITLPLITPYLFFITIISIVSSFKVFREAYILCGGHPHKSIYMIQHFMNNNFYNLNYVRLATSAILVFIVIFLLAFIMLKIRNRLSVEGSQ